VSGRNAYKCQGVWGADFMWFASHRVITYVLLCGYQPFRSDDPNEVAKETMRGRIEFHERYWKNVSDEGGSVKVDQGVGHDRVC